MTSGNLSRNAASPSNIVPFIQPRRTAEMDYRRAFGSQDIQPPIGVATVRIQRVQNDEVTQQPGAMVRALFAAREEAAHRVAMLTTREHEIMDLILTGCPNKIIAWKTGISQRTVENHRATIMKKTGSESIPALARLAVAADWNGMDDQSLARAAVTAD